MKQIAYMLVGLLAGFILSAALFLVIRLPEGKPIPLEPSPTKAPIEVHVIGGVLHPGVYSFPEGSRVQDAINAAGGLVSNADPSSINLAAKLEDGQQLEIPGGEGGTGSTSGTGGTSGGAPFSVVPTVGPTAVPQEDLININTATVDELDKLPGIGPTTAQNIIDYRQAHGPFSSIEDLINVQGIGANTMDQIRNLITVGQ